MANQNNFPDLVTNLLNPYFVHPNLVCIANTTSSEANPGISSSQNSSVTLT